MNVYFCNTYYIFLNNYYQQLIKEFFRLGFQLLGFQLYNNLVAGIIYRKKPLKGKFEVSERKRFRIGRELQDKKKYFQSFETAYKCIYLVELNKFKYPVLLH